MVIGTATAVTERPTITPDHTGNPPRPPFGERDERNNKPKRPHMTWKQQFIESWKTLDPQRAIGLLATRPMRDILTRIGAVAKARKVEKGYLREFGETIDHKTVLRRQHEDQQRKWDDWTDEHVKTMRFTGAFAIAVLAASGLGIATAPALL